MTPVPGVALGLELEKAYGDKTCQAHWQSQLRTLYTFSVSQTVEVKQECEEHTTVHMSASEKEDAALHCEPGQAACQGHRAVDTALPPRSIGPPANTECTWPLRYASRTCAVLAPPLLPGRSRSASFAGCPPLRVILTQRALGLRVRPLLCARCSDGGPIWPRGFNYHLHITFPKLTSPAQTSFLSTRYVCPRPQNRHAGNAPAAPVQTGCSYSLQEVLKLFCVALEWRLHVLTHLLKPKPYNRKSEP